MFVRVMWQSSMPRVIARSMTDTTENVIRAARLVMSANDQLREAEKLIGALPVSDEAMRYLRNVKSAIAHLYNQECGDHD